MAAVVAVDVVKLMGPNHPEGPGIVVRGEARHLPKTKPFIHNRADR